MLHILKASALTIGVVLTIGCDSGRDTRAPNVSDTSARDDRAQFNEPGAIRVGWRGPGSGGGFSVSVGAKFGQAEAEEVLRRLVALDSSGAFEQFTCRGDSVAHFGFDLTLHQQGELQERIVSLGHTPELKPWGPQECLDRGFNYMVARTFAEVDSGPSVDYGYANPSTGKEIPSNPPGERHSRWWPTCHCEKRDSVQEWVTNGPEETSLGANAH